MTNQSLGPVSPCRESLLAAGTSRGRCHRRLVFTLLSLAIGGWSPALSAWATDADPKAIVIQRIAFGSCCKQDKPMPIWSAIATVKPDVFLMIGDNIYGDSEDLSVLKAKWDRLGSDAGLQRVRQQCRFYGTWDDHDYGVNDGGVEYPQKVGSQKLFLDFFGEPSDSPRRQQAGVYTDYTFGPIGQRVQLLLLDTRYHRSPLKRHGTPREKGKPYFGPYGPNTDADATLLGEDQWSWLTAKLREPADLRVIASSIQVLPDGHFWEKWGNFPAERARLFRTLRETQAKNVVFLSGDRHHAEISRNDTLSGQPVFDVTSSSLNAPSGTAVSVTPSEFIEPNADRVAEIYRPVNFGLLTVDWAADSPSVAMEIRGEDGAVVRSQVMPLKR